MDDASTQMPAGTSVGKTTDPDCGPEISNIGDGSSQVPGTSGGKTH